METENKNNLLPQIISHPLTKVEFDKLLDNDDKLFKLYNEYAKEKIGKSLGLPSDIVKTITLGKSSSGEFVVFSKEVSKGLKEGKYYQAKKGDLISTVARDTKNAEIRGHGGIKPKLSIIAVGIGVANTISNLDTQNQMEEIKEAINRVYIFQASDRIGDLQGTYDTLQNWLNRLSKDGLTDINIIKGEGVSERLDRLENQFFENAKRDLETIENPADYGCGLFGFFKHLNILGKTPEEKAEEKLKIVFENLQYTKICNFLNLVVCGELEDNDAYERTSARLYSKFEKIHKVLDLKCQYSSVVYRNLKEGEILDQQLKCIDKQRKLELSVKVVSDLERIG